MFTRFHSDLRAKCVACLLLFLVIQPTNALDILTAGDSITQGLQRTASGAVFGITSFQNGSVNIGGYQPRLKARLDAQVESSTLYNWGRGGENSAGGVGRINSILNSRTADLILIMYGANDLYQGISSSGTRANISVMIDRSRASGVIPIISEVTLNTNGSFNPSIRLDYNPMIHSLANQKGVSIATNYVALDGPNWYAVPYHSGDQLHLSNAGYERMAEAWLNVIRGTSIPGSGGGYLESVMQIIFLDE